MSSIFRLPLKNILSGNNVLLHLCQLSMYSYHLLIWINTFPQNRTKFVNVSVTESESQNLLLLFIFLCVFPPRHSNCPSNSSANSLVWNESHNQNHYGTLQEYLFVSHILDDRYFAQSRYVSLCNSGDGGLYNSFDLHLLLQWILLNRWQNFCLFFDFISIADKGSISFF